MSEKSVQLVVAGESIAARLEIQRMLEEVSAGFYTGVLVNDPTRGYGILIVNMLDVAS